MQKVLAIDNYCVPATDMKASVHFYQTILGMPKHFEFPAKGLVAFRAAEGEAAIILKDKQHFPDTQPSILLQVADVRATYKQLREEGVVFTREPFRIQTGWSAELLDPSGNHIGITDYNVTE